MDTKPEMDPWANMGNMPGSRATEVSPEGLAREAAWNKAMTDAPNFNNDQTGVETLSVSATQPEASTFDGEAQNRDENIADATAILNYGLNAAAREKGVEATIQAINDFVPRGEGNPILQLLADLGIDTSAEFQDLAEESHAAKPSENAFRKEDINAPATIRKSPEGAMSAIKEVKELVAEVQTSPTYANLRAEALSNGKGIFEYAVSKYGVRDLTVLFTALSEQKDAYEKSLDQKPVYETPSTGEKQSNDAQTENQSSTENPSPDTEATAIDNPLL